MTDSGKRWTIQDREGNAIYLTEERWSHIIENHPEIESYEPEVKVALARGRRRQEPLNQRKYRYVMPFSDLPEDYTHIVVIALFGVVVDIHGESASNNWVATAFMKHIRGNKKPK